MTHFVPALRRRRKWSRAPEAAVEVVEDGDEIENEILLLMEEDDNLPYLHTNKLIIHTYLQYKVPTCITGFMRMNGRETRSLDLE